MNTTTDIDVAQANRMAESKRFKEARLPMEDFDEKQALVEEADILSKMAGIASALLGGRRGILAVTMNAHEEDIVLKDPKSGAIIAVFGVRQHEHCGDPVNGHFDVRIKAPVGIRIERVPKGSVQ